MPNKTGRKSEKSTTAEKGGKKERPQGSGSVGSHKPGGDGRGNKKVHEDHDVRRPRK